MKSLSEYLNESMESKEVNESVLLGVLAILKGLIILLGLLFVDVAFWQSWLKDVRHPEWDESDGNLLGYIKQEGPVLGTITWFFMVVGDAIEPIISKIQSKIGEKQWNKKKEELLADPEIQQFIHNPKKFKRLKDIKPLLVKHGIIYWAESDWWKVIKEIDPNVDNEMKQAAKEVE